MIGVDADLYETDPATQPYVMTSILKGMKVSTYEAVLAAGNELTRYLAGGNVDVPGLGWLFQEGLSDLFLGAAMLGFMIFRPDGLLGDREIDEVAIRRLPAPPEPPD